MRRCIVLVLLLVSCVVGQRINAQTVADFNADSGSSANSSSAGAPHPTGNGDSLDWLFPVTKLNRSLDRKSTRLNSSHRCISYAVFCLKKKNTRITSLP